MLADAVVVAALAQAADNGSAKGGKDDRETDGGEFGTVK